MLSKKKYLYECVVYPPISRSPHINWRVKSFFTAAKPGTPDVVVPVVKVHEHYYKYYIYKYLHGSEVHVYISSCVHSVGLSVVCTVISR